MRRAELLVIVICSALILSRAIGVHVHLEHVGPEHGLAASVTHDHDHGPIVSAYDDHHSAAHLQHGDVDASGQDMTPGKLPSLLLAALVASVFALLLPPLSRAVQPPPYSPRPRRRRSRLLPPSQAPPLAS
jgi:hypothetical protein